MDHANTPRPAPAAWTDAVEQARAQVAAAPTIDLAAVLKAYEGEDNAELAAEAAAGAATQRQPAAGE